MNSPPSSPTPCIVPNCGTLGELFNTAALKLLNKLDAVSCSDESCDANSWVLGCNGNPPTRRGDGYRGFGKRCSQGGYTGQNGIHVTRCGLRVLGGVGGVSTLIATPSLPSHPSSDECPGYSVRFYITKNAGMPRPQPRLFLSMGGAPVDSSARSRAGTTSSE